MEPIAQIPGHSTGMSLRVLTKEAAEGELATLSWLLQQDQYTLQDTQTVVRGNQEVQLRQRKMQGRGAWSPRSLEG